MKIAVTGKGGVGKTTISAVLARLYAEEGKKVFAVDVDPDANLGLALGFSEEELESITPISKMRRLIEERTGADKSNTFYKVNPKVDDIPEIYGKENIVFDFWFWELSTMKYANGKDDNNFLKNEDIDAGSVVLKQEDG